MALNFLLRHLGIGYYNHRIPRLNQSRGRSVKTDHAATAWSWNHIGLKTSTVIIVYNLYFLILEQVGTFHQVLIDGNTAHVVEVRLCHGCAVNFGFHHGSIHELPLLW
ncbi:hypothetical protein D3C72_2073730 [compost metagenome]